MLLSIQALLSAPNPDDPLDTTVAEAWKKDEESAIEEGERSGKLGHNEVHLHGVASPAFAKNGCIRLQLAVYNTGCSFPLFFHCSVRPRVSRASSV